MFIGQPSKARSMLRMLPGPGVTVVAVVGPTSPPEKVSNDLRFY